MQLTQNISLPPTYGKVVAEYLKLFKHGEYYDAFTLDDNLKIITVKGIVQNNNRYHPHHNYDKSEDELFVRYIASAKTEKRFWTVDFNEINAIRMQHIEAWTNTLKTELKKYE
jgi:hypothetical protein